MKNRKRNVQIIIRVTEEERALIEEKMQQIPTLNLSAYARKMLIDGYIITLDLQEVKGHTAQLQKIGVNINQIAKRINETGQIYADDMDEVKRVMEEVWRLERRFLSCFLPPVLRHSFYIGKLGFLIITIRKIHLFPHLLLFFYPNDLSPQTVYFMPGYQTRSFIHPTPHFMKKHPGMQSPFPAYTK